MDPRFKMKKDTDGTWDRLRAAAVAINTLVEEEVQFEHGTFLL